MLKSFILAAVLFISAAVSVFAQTPTQNASENVSLDTILREAEQQSANYREAFKNLLALETKTFETFNKNGEVKDRTTVESNFFVYQSSKDEQVSSELRNVIRVNGKLVPDSQSRADRFLAELQKSSTAESELEKIQKEGSRYDKNLEISGFTLNQVIFLDENLRSFFEYNLLGKETIGENEVFVVAYRQTRKSPHIAINEKGAAAKNAKATFDVEIPTSLKKADVLVRGKIWIDTNTYQIWREEREIIVQTQIPLVAMRTVLEYQPSNFEILVPKQISLQENFLKKNSKDNQYSVSKNIKVDFDYSEFRKSETEVIILDDDN